MTTRQTYTDKERAKAVRAFKKGIRDGQTPEEIADELDIIKGTVQRWVRNDAEARRLARIAKARSNGSNGHKKNVAIRKGRNFTVEDVDEGVRIVMSMVPESTTKDAAAKAGVSATSAKKWIVTVGEHGGDIDAAVKELTVGMKHRETTPVTVYPTPTPPAPLPVRTPVQITPPAAATVHPPGNGSVKPIMKAPPTDPEGVSGSQMERLIAKKNMYLKEIAKIDQAIATIQGIDDLLGDTVG